jgi:hypothetical protein
MRTLLAVAALAVGVGGLVAQDDKKADAKAFESKDGKFKATFPTEPKEIKQKASGLDLVITIAEKGKDGGYAVIYSDMPAEVVKAAPAAKLLEGGEKGLVDNFKAKVTKSKETTFGKQKYPAREILGEKDTLHLRVTIILADNRLYQVFVVGPKDMVTGKEADAFFESFEITKEMK